jgi:transcriptional regulator with XRE-family HTH domain
MTKNKKTKNKSQDTGFQTFGQRVRTIRNCLKLTQKEFCKGLGITSQHLSDIELDIKKPCHDFFFNMITVYHVNVHFLLIGKGAIFLAEEKKEEIAPGIFKTGDHYIDTFLYHFFNTEMVRFNALFNFSKLVRDEQINLDQNLLKEDEKIK